LYNSDAVVSRDTGTRIKMADSEGDFLTECRVIFVVGPRPESPMDTTVTLLDTLMGTLPSDSLSIDTMDVGLIDTLDTESNLDLDH